MNEPIVQYQIVDDQIVDDSEDAKRARITQQVEDNVAAGLEGTHAQLKQIASMLRDPTRERENRRALRGRVAQRRRKNKLEKASRKANR